MNEAEIPIEKFIFNKMDEDSMEKRLGYIKDKLMKRIIMSVYNEDKKDIEEIKEDIQMENLCLDDEFIDRNNERFNNNGEMGIENFIYDDFIYPFYDKISVFQF